MKWLCRMASGFLFVAASSADHTDWVDHAIIYGVTPYIFTEQGRLDGITAKLPELAELGVNTLWLQPLFANHGGGQGYDIIDYFQLRDDVGSEEDLRELVRTSHNLGIRVILDFPINHTSIKHPYAQDTIQRGAESPYYDYYQREPDTVRYARHYRTRTEGKMSFVHYFWEDMPNLNHDHPAVRRKLIEAGRHWIERFDIDGYRLDASWGMNYRSPSFLPEWREAMKEIKPDILILGEDKATDPRAFENRYDVAYDWAAGDDWVSQWAWEVDYTDDRNDSRTIFNHTPADQRAAALRRALTNDGQGYPENARVLRFMENNDTARFIQAHGLPRTRMAAALLFALDGIPMIFNGQEVGESRHPYETGPLFAHDQSIRARDQHGLFDYYAKLARMRTAHPALRAGSFHELDITPGDALFAFARRKGDETILTAVNLAETPKEDAVIHIPAQSWALEEDVTWRLTDLLTEEQFEVNTAELSRLTLPLDSYQVRIMRLDSLAHSAP